MQKPHICRFNLFGDPGSIPFIDSPPLTTVPEITLRRRCVLLKMILREVERVENFGVSGRDGKFRSPGSFVASIFPFYSGVSRLEFVFGTSNRHVPMQINFATSAGTLPSSPHPGSI